MLRVHLKERATCIYRIVSIDNGAAPKAAVNQPGDRILPAIYTFRKSSPHQEVQAIYISAYLLYFMYIPSIGLNRPYCFFRSCSVTSR